MLFDIVKKKQPKKRIEKVDSKLIIISTELESLTIRVFFYSVTLETTLMLVFYKSF